MRGLRAVCLGVGLLVLLLFAGIKRTVGGKLVGSDIFGRSEYYLGMGSGFVRVTCMLLAAMARRKVRNGEFYCPCRVVTGDREKDRPSICPCDEHRKQIAETGHCRCGLFFKPGEETKPPAGAAGPTWHALSPGPTTAHAAGSPTADCRRPPAPGIAAAGPPHRRPSAGPSPRSS